MRHALVTYSEVLVLTAPAGAGKTTLLVNFLGACEGGDVFIARVSATDLPGGNLFDHVLSLFDIAEGEQDKFSAMEKMGKRLNNYTHALLAIDDAHSLTDSAFKDLLILSYLRRARGPLLQIFLVGEDSLVARLETCELVKMSLWPKGSHRLMPFNRLENEEFIQGWFARLEDAPNPVFTPEGLELIHRWSRGIPSRLIRLCHWFWHNGTDDDWRNGLGRDEVRRGIRGQRGLEIVEAHSLLAAHDSNVAVSLSSPCPPEADPALIPPDNSIIFSGAVSTHLEVAAPDSETGARGFNEEHPVGIRRSVLAALVFLGLVGSFQLGGHLSKPTTTRINGPAAPAQVQPAPEDVTADTGLAIAPVIFSAAQASPDQIDAEDLPTAEVEAIVRAGNIETLLRLGEKALEKDYLRTPREESAWYYYQQVLELDPGNLPATLGMKLIVSRYAELTRVTLERGNLDSAQTYILRGLSVEPRDATLTRLQGDVDTARAERY